MRAGPRSDGRWVVVGAGGMLGHDVLQALQGRDVVALPRSDLDITDLDAVHDALSGADVIVNCAAWTAVDDAETREGEAFAVNALGPANLARATAWTGAWLIHPSTDYVFAGNGSTPYAEDAPMAPRSAYGRTKAAGEWAVRTHAPTSSYVVRTAWLYGAHGPSFVRTMARLASERDTVDVVADQHGQPTWSGDLARRLVEMVDRAAPAGVYHGTSGGQTTWYALARKVFSLLGTGPERVRPTTSAAFARPAPRPGYSVLGHDGWGRAGLAPMRAWDEALEAAWPELGFSD